MSEFKEFSKIERWQGSTHMVITQKIHGTNAQVYIYKDEHNVPQLLCGCRTRWITPEEDNYGFAKFVYEHKQLFIDTLGEGRHFGEWAGPGINSGEGLTEKRFVLFSPARYADKALPPKTCVVPILYEGPLDFERIQHCFLSLKTSGSFLVEGFMRPEGIVIEVLNKRFKQVFEPEETGWIRAKKVKKPTKEIVDVSHLLQPIRMQKLFSRDEQYLRSFPNSLPQICKDYVADLLAENQFSGSEDEQALIKKELGRHVFKLAKAVYENAH